MSDGCNGLNIVQRYQHWRLWKRLQNGHVMDNVLRGTDKRIPWLLLRKEMIKKKFPDVDDDFFKVVMEEKQRIMRLCDKHSTLLYFVLTLFIGVCIGFNIIKPNGYF